MARFFQVAAPRIPRNFPKHRGARNRCFFENVQLKISKNQKNTKKIQKNDWKSILGAQNRCFLKQKKQLKIIKNQKNTQKVQQSD